MVRQLLVVHRPQEGFAENSPAGTPALPGDGALRLWHGAGCPECNRTGFKGRQGVFELLMIDERFHDPILKRSGAPEYQRLGQERGMRTMFEDGLIKCLKGMTTIEELLRVTRLAPR